MSNENWVLVGKVSELKTELESLGGLKEVAVGDKSILLSYANGNFGALATACNHMGGPLAKGKMIGNHVECPWHYWQFNHQTGEALSSTTAPMAPCGGKMPSFPLKQEGGELFVDMANRTKREPAKYDAEFSVMNVARDPKRTPGKIRVLGISTTAMDKNHPRYSTSEDLLKSALKEAEQELGVETQIISLSDLNFRNCEGFYSKSERACTWPCSISKIDTKDEMVKIYEALVHWCDVVVVATPIRWGAASSLYYKMVERLNPIQNQITLYDDVIIQNKVAAFIITGGQDNIQAVSGQMLTFFGELGFHTPPFPFVGHSLGWTSEDMERNMDYVQKSEELHKHSFELLQRSVELCKKLLGL